MPKTSSILFPKNLKPKIRFGGYKIVRGLGISRCSGGYGINLSQLTQDPGQKEVQAQRQSMASRSKITSPSSPQTSQAYENIDSQGCPDTRYKVPRDSSRPYAYIARSKRGNILPYTSLPC
jgi:hypothetical protein